MNVERFEFIDSAMGVLSKQVKTKKKKMIKYY